MTTRDFHPGTVLSVTTGRLLSPDGIGGLYEILNWMTGDNLFTHQLIRASQECQEPLLAQHPALRDVTIPDDPGPDGWDAFIEGLAVTYGSTLAVAPLDPKDHTVVDPIAELKMMRPDIDPIVVVSPRDGDQS